MRDPDDNRSQFHYWDCWTIFDSRHRIFHVFRLYAEKRRKVDDTHDQYARLAYASTATFEAPLHYDNDIVKPDEKSSIWTGCVVRAPDRRYLLFLTERTSRRGYWADQSVFCATSADLRYSSWRREAMRLTPESLDPEGAVFLRRPRRAADGTPIDRTIHAWRDPFVFAHGGDAFMLLCAKLQSAPATRAACVALLRASDSSLLQWKLVHQALVGGFEELEVPQLYLDASTGEAVLLASTWDESDYQESMDMGYDPLQNLSQTRRRSRGNLLSFRARSIDDAIAGRFSPASIVVGPERRMYAGVLVPELGGAIMGFDIDTERLSIPTDIRLRNLQHVNPAWRTAGE